MSSTAKHQFRPGDVVRPKPSSRYGAGERTFIEDVEYQGYAVFDTEYGRLLEPVAEFEAVYRVPDRAEVEALRAALLHMCELYDRESGDQQITGPYRKLATEGSNQPATLPAAG